MATVKKNNKQRDVDYALDLMRKSYHFIRKHKNVKGAECYRLLDETVHPVLNLEKEATEEAIMDGRLKKFCSRCLDTKPKSSFKWNSTIIKRC